MRKFSVTVNNLLNNDTIRFYFLIKLEFTQTYYITDFHSNITFLGNTYLADGGIFEYDSPKASSVVDRESYKVVLSDISDSLLAEFRNGVVGKPITVYAGFLNVNGEPIVTSNDVLLVYKGFVDSPAIENNFESKMAIIEGTSPMADLDAVNVFMTSRDGMDQRSATDTSFDDMNQDNEIKQKWGKI